MTHQQLLFVITLCVTLVMSLITFFTFLIDKKKAVNGSERIKEKVLLSMTSCFGSIGALLGRLAWHHKTDKVYFSIVIWTSLVLNVALIVYLLIISYFI